MEGWIFGKSPINGGHKRVVAPIDKCFNGNMPFTDTGFLTAGLDNVQHGFIKILLSEFSKNAKGVVHQLRIVLSIHRLSCAILEIKNVDGSISRVRNTGIARSKHVIST